MTPRIPRFEKNFHPDYSALHKRKLPWLPAAAVCLCLLISMEADAEAAEEKMVIVLPPVPAEHVKKDTAAVFSISDTPVQTFSAFAAAEETVTGFVRPATGRITSEYGPRNGRMHHGIDIGRGGRMNVPVTAAAAGTVVEAKYRNGYGNTVMVSHTMNGREMMTLYAHLASIGVTAGRKVAQGEKLGLMGNTGASRGPHLHFEVHEGVWDTRKSRSVNPRRYVDF
ncbi:M23 family metallopeptidase [Sinobaca qinghaiensis]|uniref:M23 family metallopeptidase n=1 Tax=Sinobaca qinghaiensis TaxID=342944 RepID=UPI001FEB7868|nr:M23 family metallopeptidase [Sinobaca qinghaiensis]